MSYEFYKILHVFSVVVLFSSLGVLAAFGSSREAGLRRFASIAHGVALAVIFVAGFGLLARLGMFGSIPGWAWAKMVVWFLLGAAVIPIRRRPDLAARLWSIVMLVGGVAVWLAIQKPF